MYRDESINRYHFLPDEERWLIEAVIELTEARNLKEHERQVVLDLLEAFIPHKNDPFIEVVERFLRLAKNYGVEGKPASMVGYVDGKYSMYHGNGRGNRLEVDDIIDVDPVEERHKMRLNFLLIAENNMKRLRCGSC